MSWLLLASATAATALVAARSLDLKQKVEQPYELATQNYDERAPIEGYWQDASKVIFSANNVRGNFKSVKEDFDARGARIFITCFDDGCKTIFYADPRIQK